MTAVLWITLVLVVIGFAGARYGVDTRDGADWRSGRVPADRPARRRFHVRADVAALRRWVRQAGW